VDSALGPSPSEPGGGHDSAGFADVDEFSRALVEIGLLSDRELQRFSASSSVGVLGLARALVRAGKLTPYQAAAVYQRKARSLVVGKYIVLEELGRGGMGTVFRAHHRILGRSGALRILPPTIVRDRAAFMQYRGRIELLRRLTHHNLAATDDAGEERGLHYLVTEYVEGHNLDRVIRERGLMRVEQAIDCVTQAARGLEAAHAQGIVHGDIKPSKLMLDYSGTVRVLDLGLAGIVAAGNLRGEAVEYRIADERTDIYSLGCTLSYLLTGQSSVDGTADSEQMTAHAERPTPSLRTTRPDVSPRLDSVFQRMTANLPDERPASMTEVIALLDSCNAVKRDLASAGDEATTQAEPTVVDQPPRKHGGEAKAELEASLSVRRQEHDGWRINRELSLEDLMMEVRPDVAPSRPPRAPKPEMAKSNPLRRRPPKSAATRPRRTTVVLLAVASAVALAAALAVFAWLLAVDQTGAGLAPAHSLRLTESSPITGKSRDQTDGLVQVPPASKTRWEAKTLFDGRNGQSWMLLNRKPLPRANIQEDGLNPHGTGSYLVVFYQKLADFILDFDYKLTQGCNSGVFLRVSNLNDPINTGIEVALDDTSGTGLHDAGAIDDLVAPAVPAQLPAGTWNHISVAAIGPRISVTLNGTEVSAIDLDLWTVPGKRPDGSLHKYKNVAVASLARSGYLGFQDNGRDCWFKNVAVKSPSNSEFIPSPARAERGRKPGERAAAHTAIP
jgi:serine/threonine protein kinase